MGVEAEVQRLSVSVLEREIRVDVVKHRSGVAGLVARTAESHVELTGEIAGVGAFPDGDSDGTLDFLDRLEVDVGPLRVVDEIIQGGVQPSMGVSA